MQFSTWFQVTATILMTLGLVIANQMNGQLGELREEIIADRMILNAHLIEHPTHALDTRISILEEWKRSTDIE